MPGPPTPAPDDRPETSPSAAAGLRLVSLDGSRSTRFTFDGRTLAAGPGETIAVALLAAGLRTLRTTSRRGEPRGLFCNMGVCFECLVEVDGQANVRACQTLVLRDMQVRTQHGTGTEPSP